MTIRRTTAPYARKAGDDDDDKPKPSRNERAERDDKEVRGFGDVRDPRDLEELKDDPGDKVKGAAARADDKPDKAADKAETTAAAERAAADKAAADKAAAAQRAAADKAAADKAAAQQAAVATTPPPMEKTELAQLLPPDAIDTSWDAAADAPPPGKAPPGDSRSFRRIQGGSEEFVLLYRFKSFLVTRAGKVGKMGEWRVVEYPSMGSAAHAYAHECSDLTAQGYRDFYG